MSIHQEIMNLPGGHSPAGNHPEALQLRAYAMGHRDARHAAAELAQAREAELVRVIKGLLKNMPPVDCGDFHHEPSEYHDGEGPCKPEQRFNAAVEVAREAVKQ